MAQSKIIIKKLEDFKEAMLSYIAAKDHIKRIDAADVLKILMETPPIEELFQKAKVDSAPVKNILDRYISRIHDKNKDIGGNLDEYIAETAQGRSIEDMAPKRLDKTMDQVIDQWQHQQAIHPDPDQIIRKLFLTIAENCRPRDINGHYTPLIGEEVLAKLEKAQKKLTKPKKSPTANEEPENRLLPGASVVHVSVQGINEELHEGNSHGRA